MGQSDRSVGQQGCFASTIGILRGHVCKSGNKDISHAHEDYCVKSGMQGGQQDCFASTRGLLREGKRVQRPPPWSDASLVDAAFAQWFHLSISLLSLLCCLTHYSSLCSRKPNSKTDDVYMVS